MGKLPSANVEQMGTTLKDRQLVSCLLIRASRGLQPAQLHRCLGSEGLGLCFMVCGRHLEILHHFQARSPAPHISILYCALQIM
jgi:hypothetical protein